MSVPPTREPRSRPTYSTAFAERAVRLVADSAGQYRSQWSAIEAIAAQVGCTTETLRRWVRKTERELQKKVKSKATKAGAARSPSRKAKAPPKRTKREGPFPNNERLRELVKASGLTQVEALAIFNRGLQPRPYSLSAWKAFLSTPDPENDRFRPLSDAMLAHAVKRFTKA